MDFPTFYQTGGIFMHLVTLLALATAVSLAARTWQLRARAHAVLRAESVPKSADPMASAMLLAMVTAGALGAALGWAEMHAALRTVPQDQWHLALSRGGQIVMNPLVWSLLCALPLLLVRGGVSHFESRLLALGKNASGLPPRRAG